MSATALDYEYVYQFPSIVQPGRDGRRLQLATCGGTEKHPYFFQGRMVFPRKTADFLLTLSEISRTRFYSPTELRERLLAAADPVVTSGGERLRFEAFSVCCGVYARVDLRPEAIDGEWIGRGTTNVDFNPPMRASLSSIVDSEAVGINVGMDRVEIERAGSKTIEKKVKLPVRWLKGFVEVQSYQAKMKPILDVPAEQLRSLLRTIPNQQIWQKGSMVYVVPSGRGLRLSQRSAADAVALGAPGRLKVLDPLLRHATEVRVYGSDSGVSGWEIITPDSSFHVVLSPDASRGFSGEGQALSQLASAKEEESLAKVRAALQWQAKVDSKSISRQLHISENELQAALTVLGTRGLVGYDLNEGAFFHRELPFAHEMVEKLQPRMLNARKLIEEESVQIVKHAADRVEAYVKAKETEHRVIIESDRARCTCLWSSKHQGQRGECKHILAVRIAANKKDQ